MVIRYIVQVDSFHKWVKVHNWCRKAFGPIGHGWWYCGFNMTTITYNFEFENQDMATQVKLTWL